PISIKLGPGEAIPTLGSGSQETKYDLNDVELKQIKIRSGSLTFELQNSVDEVVDLTYTMPVAIKAGLPFTITKSIPANSTVTDTFDLSGYTIDMRGVNFNDYNTIIAQFAAFISPLATDSAVINAGENFKIKYSFRDMKTKFAAGYFGSYEISDSYTDTIDLFSNIPMGALDIDSIGLKMKVENGFGIDAQLRIDMLKSINSNTGSSAELTHSVIGNSINVTRALNAATSQTPFTYSVYDLNINTSNSNVDVLIETLPDQFQYAFVLKINPFGNNSGGNDFLYYNSDLRINVDLEVPVRFSASGLTLMDTLSFDLGTDPDSEHETTITGGFFRIFANNGFPFDAKLQVYLYDANFLIVDSLLSSTFNTILAAPVDVNNKVTSKLESRLDIPVDDDKIINFEKATRAIVKVVFTTKPNNQIVSIYSDYELDLKLIGDFTYRAKIN
ncbi:MAG: hypothetical protein JKX73_03290, partial [Flavobacteriales bacterium]|nr:hypothetical protein [Flavobacteriales bacterium]